jgi:MPBQ/MSBQ methyltransferase
VSRKMIGRMNRWYDESMYRDLDQEYFGHSDFYNYGYWDERTPDQKSACENLVEKLLSYVPKKEGKILDVACGCGATTAYLLKHYSAENVTGINISERQLAKARERAPRCTFLIMDAVQMEFEDNTFDAVLSVEAAVHFDSRSRFLCEACRVLKPGGFLVLSDILSTDWGKQHRLWWIAESNAALRIDEYGELCRKSGFGEVKVVDATRECWEPHYKSIATFAEKKLLAKDIDVKTYEKLAAGILRLLSQVGTYVLVAARKM